MPNSTTTPAWRLTAECPRCRNALVVRYARHDHQPFIGCIGYPHCRYTCEYDDALQGLAYRTVMLEGDVRALFQQKRALEADIRRLSLTTNTRALSSPEGLTRALTTIIATAHPDRWSQGQSATALAHELTTALLALREQIQRGR